MNAMMWIRGFAADYDEWAEHCGEQWSFNGIVKYFNQIENVEGAHGPDEGVGGRLHISRQRSPHPLTAAWLQAVQQTGHTIERPNLPQPNGFSQTMVTQRRGARWSAADAWLRPGLRRKNLKLITNATATRVIFVEKQAVAVEFDNNGRREFVRARCEVVVCAGTVNSPQLLMLSGIVSAAQRDRVERYIQQGLADGGTVTTGGKRPPHLPNGYFVEPTIFAGLDNSSAVAREEIFGPVLTVIAYDDEDDAIRIANDSEYGLGGTVWSPDRDHAVAVAARVHSGTVGINHYLPDITAPYGGIKNSGMGRELGPEGLREFQHVKSIFLS